VPAGPSPAWRRIFFTVVAKTATPRPKTPVTPQIDHFQGAEASLGHLAGLMLTAWTAAVALTGVELQPAATSTKPADLRWRKSAPGEGCRERLARG
jgi:hypothetical protein